MPLNFTPIPIDTEPVRSPGGSPEMREYPQTPPQEISEGVEQEKIESAVDGSSNIPQPQLEEDPILPETLIQAGRVASGLTDLSQDPVLELPLTDEEIFISKKASLTDPMRWLGEWCLYLLKKGHHTLKKIHGHITRIPMPNI